MPPKRCGGTSERIRLESVKHETFHRKLLKMTVIRVMFHTVDKFQWKTGQMVGLDIMEGVIWAVCEVFSARVAQSESYSTSCRGVSSQSSRHHSKTRGVFVSSAACVTSSVKFVSLFG